MSSGTFFGATNDTIKERGPGSLTKYRGVVGGVASTSGIKSVCGSLLLVYDTLSGKYWFSYWGTFKMSSWLSSESKCGSRCRYKSRLLFGKSWRRALKKFWEIANFLSELLTRREEGCSKKVFPLLKCNLIQIDFRNSLSRWQNNCGCYTAALPYSEGSATRERRSVEEEVAH